MLHFILFLIFCVLYGFVLYKRGDPVRIKYTLLFAGVWAALLVLSRVLLFFLYFDYFRQVNLLYAFWPGLRFDLAVFAVFGGPFLILLNLPVKSKRWTQLLFALAASAVFIYILASVGDLVYFKYAGRHVGEDIFNLFSSFSLIWQVIWHQYCLSFLSLLALWLGLIWGAARLTADVRQPVRGRWLWEITALVMTGWLCLLLLDGSFLWNVEFIRIDQAYTQSFKQGQLSENSVYQILYALKLTPRPRRTYQHNQPALNWQTPQQAAEITLPLYASAQETRPYPQNPFLRQRHQFNADARGKNLIILVLESWDYASTDALAGTSYGLTPNLDRLIQTGLVFDHFYSCGQNSSLLGIGALMSGTCQISGLPFFSRGLERRKFRGLGFLFQELGYNTVFVRATTDAYMYIGPLSRLMGFTSFEEKDLPSILSYPNPKTRSDYEALMFLADRFKQSAKPFFGFFFSVATHEPLGTAVPKAFGEKLESKFPQGSYQQALAYTDWAVGEFIKKLKEQGLYDNTVFILIGDHRLRAKNFPTSEAYFHVPFIITASGILPAGTDHKTGGQADLLPTLVDLFHIQEPYFSLGHSLLDAQTPHFSLAIDSRHFGLITPSGMTWEIDNEYLAPSQNNPDIRRQAVAINRAGYDILNKGQNIQPNLAQ